SSDDEPGLGHCQSVSAAGDSGEHLRSMVPRVEVAGHDAFTGDMVIHRPEMRRGGVKRCDEGDVRMPRIEIPPAGLDFVAGEGPGQAVSRVWGAARPNPPEKPL